MDEAIYQNPCTLPAAAAAYACIWHVVASNIAQQLKLIAT
jgi:hypothetical protein